MELVDAGVGGGYCERDYGVFEADDFAMLDTSKEVDKRNAKYCINCKVGDFSNDAIWEP